MITSTLPRSLRIEIDSIARAKAWIRSVVDLGLLFHFEDDAHDVLWTQPLTNEDKDILNEQRAALYNEDLDWGDDECPIGYALRVEDGEA